MTNACGCTRDEFSNFKLVQTSARTVYNIYLKHAIRNWLNFFTTSQHQECSKELHNQEIFSGSAACLVGEMNSVFQYFGFQPYLTHIYFCRMRRCAVHYGFG